MNVETGSHQRGVATNMKNQDLWVGMVNETWPDAAVA